ncbi:MAG: hypothetical protein J6D28_04670 [Bacilli bacterium]|nr:hypothetical protein [Bacilli bacterium]
MFEENENLVLDGTENVEETTEETQGTETEPTIEKPVEEVKEPEKLYTEEDFNKKLDEVLAKKIARKEAKIRKEYDSKYGRVESVLKTGLGVDSIEEATNQLSDFYTKKGIQMPSEPTYNERDMEVLAKAEADDIISSGLDEVVEEVNRLAEKGVNNMTPREKATFQRLAEYRQNAERNKELASIGVKEEVYDSQDFKDFASQFNSNTPITKVYEYYTKTLDKPTPEKMGSMKNGNSQEEKTYYSPEDVDKLTEKDLDDPTIFKRVRESMAKW